MHRILLKFLDQKTDEAYQQVIQERLILIFQVHSFINILLQGLAIVFLRGFGDENQQIFRVCIHSGQLLVTVFNLIIISRLKSMLRLIILFTGIFNTIILAELYFQFLLLSESNLLDDEFYKQTIIFQSACLNTVLTVLFIDNFKAKFSFFITAAIYLKIRINSVCFCDYIISIVLVNAMILIYNYVSERLIMGVFQSLHQDYSELQQIKIIMKEHCPQGLLIAQPLPQVQKEDQIDKKSIQIDNMLKSKLSIKNSNSIMMISTSSDFEIKFFNHNIEQLINQISVSKTQSEVLRKYTPTSLNRKQVMKKDLCNVSCQVIKQNDADVNYLTNMHDLVATNISAVGEQEYLMIVQLGNNITCSLQSQMQGQLQQQTEKKIFKVKIKKCNWDRKPSSLLVIEDYSLKMELEKLHMSNEYKDNILATVTHDLKTPINGMVAQIESVDNSNDILYIKKVIDIVKDYSQIQKKCIKVVAKNFNLRCAINQCVDLIQMQATMKQVDLIVKVLLNQDQEQIYNDDIRLKQVLLNLLSNALKCTKKGYIKLKVRCVEGKDGLIQISVKDTGSGISVQEQKNLFQLYHTRHNDKNQHGVGLGLAITKNLTELIGPKSNIKVQSKLGVGSKFTFLIYRNNINLAMSSSLVFNNKGASGQFDQVAEVNFPIAEKEEEYDSQSPKFFQMSYQNLQMKESQMEIEKDECNAQENPYINIIMNQHFKLKCEVPHQLLIDNEKKIKLLIADDEIFCIKAFKTLCVSYADQIDIIAVYDGQEALEACQSHSFDAVFLDVDMPTINGLEVAKKLVTTFPQLPIYFLSGNNDDLAQDEFFIKKKISSIRCVKKPINREIFKEVMAYLFKKKNQK